MIKICTLILIVSLLSCSNADNSKKETKARADLMQTSDKDSFPVKELFIDNGDEEGWGADIRLSITKVEKTDTSITYSANSLYENRNVGLQITIPTASPKSEKELAQVLTFTSSGTASDNFIATLAKLYKEKLDTTVHFITSKRVAFIDLDEFAKSQFGKEPVNKTAAKEMKVFFEAENPDDNAELYININEAEHWLEIREKDDGYRKQVIKGLTTK
jgi:hypothetical protein